jgi:nucleolar protein 58
MAKIVSDNLIYTKVVKAIGMRSKAVDTDLSFILPEDIEKDVKDASEISMGTEISETDEKYIWALCDQITEMTDYRASLQEYLKNRMQALAPNLTTVVGELVGARLICHAGSLVNLAKCAASTIQILGAEKALFKAIKTRHNTPKYGIIYQAQLVNGTSARNKGKVSRTLAAKCSLCARCDALGES